MRLLVATSLTQGRRLSDFTRAKDGELVYFPAECVIEDIDDPDCGCRRSMRGLVTGELTTTMTVIESKLSKKDFADLVASRLEADGAFKKLGARQQMYSVRRHGLELVRRAGLFTVGSVVERRGQRLVLRDVIQTISQTKATR